MSDYEATYTHVRRDYEANRLAMEAYRAKQDRLKGLGKTVWERLQVKLPKATLIIEQRPNPLSMELRIVLCYFWEGFKRVEARIAEFRAAGAHVTPDFKVERSGYLEDVRNICFELFDVTSPHAPFHIHSEYGCKDSHCPAWNAGGTHARENVLEWYTPDC